MPTISRLFAANIAAGLKGSAGHVNAELNQLVSGHNDQEARLVIEEAATTDYGTRIGDLETDSSDHGSRLDALDDATTGVVVGTDPSSHASRITVLEGEVDALQATGFPYLELALTGTHTIDPATYEGYNGAIVNLTGDTVVTLSNSDFGNARTVIFSVGETNNYSLTIDLSASGWVTPVGYWHASAASDTYLKLYAGDVAILSVRRSGGSNYWNVGIARSPKPQGVCLAVATGATYTILGGHRGGLINDTHSTGSAYIDLPLVGNGDSGNVFIVRKTTTATTYVRNGSGGSTVATLSAAGVYTFMAINNSTVSLSTWLRVGG